MIVEEVKQKARDIILTLLPDVGSEDISGDRDIFSFGLDSINAMMLIFSLQDAFGVKFDTSEISFENFRTLANIVALIKRKKEY